MILSVAIRFLDSFFEKKFPKYLDVSKIYFIFAPLFRFKEGGKQKGSEKSFLKKVIKKFGGLK